jgi:hypothetical protein
MLDDMNWSSYLTTYCLSSSLLCRPLSSGATMASTLISLGPDIWALPSSLRMGPIHFPLRMTVMRRNDGKLIVWSPVRMDAEALAAVRALGEVAVIVAPNSFHHLYLSAAVALFPGAKVIGVPGHERKRPDVRFDAILDSATTPERFAELGLNDGLTVVPVAGCPMVNELVAIHHASGSAVFTDTVFNVHHAPNVWSRWFWQIDGVWKRPALPRTTVIFVRDRVAFRDSLGRILQHPWQQLIMAHGDVVEVGGQQPLLDWLAANGGPARLPQ